VLDFVRITVYYIRGEFMRYGNLLAEMAMANITQNEIATLLNKTISTVSTKINGKYPFTLDEAVKIKENLFNVR
jgi:plasmid maintenance system antidote protein VapI